MVSRSPSASLSEIGFAGLEGPLSAMGSPLCARVGGVLPSEQTGASTMPGGSVDTRKFPMPSSWAWTTFRFEEAHER